MALQPLGERLGGQDPDAGGVPFAPVAALEGGAEGGGIVGEERRLQHILAVLQFQVVVVQKAAARAVDMFIGQDADVELGRQPVRKRLADGCAQGWARKQPWSPSPRWGRTASRVTASQPPSSSSTLAGVSSPMDGPPAADGPGGRTEAA